MKNRTYNLTYVKSYDGALKIQTASGNSIQIKAIGNISHSLPLHYVFYSPHLATNLLYVGQLVENNCLVSFSSSGCPVQD